MSQLEDRNSRYHVENTVGSSHIEQISSWNIENTIKSYQTPLGPPTTWVHIFLGTLDVLIEYQMKNSYRQRRKN